MIHFHYIGHFDPQDTVDLSQMPAPPKPLRPLSVEMVSRLSARFGIALGDQVELSNGYLFSNLGHEGELHPFEAALVAEGCVVMTQDARVVQPREAVNLWRRWLNALNARKRARAAAEAAARGAAGDAERADEQSR